MPLGLRGWWWWWASRRRFTQVLNTDRNAPFKGSHSKWGRSASAVQLAFRQPRSHSYSALSFQYRLPLLTSLIAFSQSLGYVFDESIKTLCIAKQAKPKSHQGSAVLHCIFSALCWTFLSALALVPFDIPRSEYLTVNNIDEVHTTIAAYQLLNLNEMAPFRSCSLSPLYKCVRGNKQHTDDFTHSNFASSRARTVKLYNYNVAYKIRRLHPLGIKFHCSFLIDESTCAKLNFWPYSDTRGELME